MWRFILLLFFFFPAAVEAKLLINEVLPNPTSANDASEWIELFNSGDMTIDLRDYTIDGKKLTRGEPVSVAPAEYIVVTKSLNSFLTEFGAVGHVVELGITLGNSGDQVTIAGATESETISFASSSDNRSWERKGRFCPELARHTQSNTVGKVNSHFSPDCDSEKLNFEVLVSLDELNWVKGLKTRGEITLFVRTTLTDNTAVTFRLDNEEEFTSSFNLSSYLGKVTGCVSPTNCFSTELITIVPDLQIIEVMPNPDGADKDQEWVKVFNPTNKQVALAGIRLEDGVGELLEFESDDVITAKSFITVSLPGSPLLNCTSSGCSEKVKLLIGEEMIDEMAYSSTKSGIAWRRQGSTWTLEPETPPAAAAPPPSLPPISSPPPAPTKTEIVTPLVYPKVNLQVQSISGKFFITHRTDIPIEKTLLVLILFTLNLIFMCAGVWEKIALVLIHLLRPVWTAWSDTPHVIVLETRHR